MNPSGEAFQINKNWDSHLYRFDETEFTGSDPQSRINNPMTPVRFRGVVEIEGLDWLAPKAREYLEKDIQERDIHIHTQTRAHPISDLTLEMIYRRDPVFKGKGHTIKVEIHGFKGVSALYLSEFVPRTIDNRNLNKYSIGDQLPNGLLFYTKDQ